MRHRPAASPSLATLTNLAGLTSLAGLTRMAILTILTMALTALASPCAARAESAETTGFPTLFLLLTGSPEPAAEGTAGVLMVPGTVIPVTAEGAGGAAGAHQDPDQGIDAMLESGRSATDLAEKLRATLRLADIQVQYAEPKILDFDAPTPLPAATPGSAVRPVVTLLGLTDELATYRVVFRKGDAQLSDTSVSIPLGRRSVVGALDGPEAPYLFLVVQPPANRPLTVSDASPVVPPRRLSGAAPSYPEDARKAHVQGVVVVQAVIAKDGTVAQTRVLRRLTPSLDQASEEAIRTWTFEPATLDGEPVSVFYNLTINFRLSKDEDADDEGAQDG